MASDLNLGQSVELSDGRKATVQYIGETHFATGSWVGVELETATGKNDGEVQGQRYFETQPGHGMFIRPTAVSIIDQTTPRARVSASKAKAPDATTTSATRTRPSRTTASGTTTKRQSMVDPVVNKRQSVNAASPSPGPRISRIMSPSKSPTKGLEGSRSASIVSRTSASSTTSRRSIAPSPSPLSRPTSMGPPSLESAPSRSMRTSVTPALQSRPTRPTSQESRVPERIGSLSSTSQAEAVDDRASHPASPAPAVETAALDAGRPPPETAKDSIAATLPDSDPRSPSKAPLASRSTHGASSQREVEDLKTKLRLMEKKRLEDREKLKALDKIQTERDRFESVIQKLQTKYQPQQQELTDIRRQVKEGETAIQALQAQVAEHESQSEMATLDREMAEEISETLQAELNSIKQKSEEMELEISVLREENDELGKEISPEEKTSQGWLQLERSNDRLRDALMRLRDVSQEQEADMKAQIAELEADTQELVRAREQLQTSKDNLAQSNATIEDLRQQLDAALGAEDMIEELTERNMSLSEEVKELKLTIEDLENLRELNDELEINHTETEKELQQEIDYNEALLAEEARKAAIQDGVVQDLEYTVSRFRTLVTTMQGDLADMRASQQLSETESADLSSKARAMLDLNMRLQSSAAKTQVKAVDIELQKLEAQGSADHLFITQMFIPEAYRREQVTTQAFLRFRRVAFKSTMLQAFAKDNLRDNVIPGSEEDVITSGLVIDQLVWISATCHRFDTMMRCAELDAYHPLGALYGEMDPVERTMDSIVQGLRRGELMMSKWADDLSRNIALMSHLAELHIPEDLNYFADRILTQTAVVQSNYESSAAILTSVKSGVERHPAMSIESQVAEDINDLMTRLDEYINQTRSAKIVAQKAGEAIKDLQSRNLSPDPATTASSFDSAADHARSMAGSIRTYGLDILRFLTENTSSASTDDSHPIFAAISSSQLSLPTLATMISTSRTQIEEVYTLTNKISQTVETTLPTPLPDLNSSNPPTPWHLLAQKISTETASATQIQTEFAHLKDEINAKTTAIALKDKKMEELAVQTEILEKRASEASAQKGRVRTLEQTVEAAALREREWMSKTERARRALENMERLRDAAKKELDVLVTKIKANGQHGVDFDSSFHDDGNILPSSSSAPTSKQVSLLETRIHALEATIRHLRLSHRETIFTPQAKSFLSTPIIPDAQALSATRLAPYRVPRPTGKSQDDISASKNDLPPLQLLDSLLTLMSDTQVTKVVKVHRHDGSWRPVKETGQWQVALQREKWEGWKDERRRVLRRHLPIRSVEGGAKSVKIVG